MQRRVANVPLVTPEAPLELSRPDAVADHEQVLLEAVRGVISEGIQWIRRCLCFRKSAELAGFEFRKLGLLGGGEKSRLFGSPKPFCEAAFLKLGFRAASDFLGNTAKGTDVLQQLVARLNSIAASSASSDSWAAEMCPNTLVFRSLLARLRS